MWHTTLVSGMHHRKKRKHVINVRQKNVEIDYAHEIQGVKTEFVRFWFFHGGNDLYYSGLRHPLVLSVGINISEQPTFRTVFSSQVSSSYLPDYEYNVVSQPRDHNTNIFLFQIMKLFIREI